MMSRMIMPVYMDAMVPQNRVRIVGHQLRRRGDAHGHERAEHHRRGPGTGNAQGEQRDERTRTRGVVGRLRRRQPSRSPFAEWFRVSPDFLFRGVGHERGDGGAGAGQHPDEKAEDRAAADGPDNHLAFLFGDFQGGDLVLVVLVLGLGVFFGGQREHFGKGEQSRE